MPRKRNNKIPRPLGRGILSEAPSSARALRVCVCLTVSFLVFHPIAQACRCTVPTADLLRSDAVFVGTVEEIVIEDPIADLTDSETTEDRQVATVYVQRVWKGAIVSPQIVATPADHCGSALIVGYAYLMFARRDPTGRLMTDRCDGTKHVQDSLAELERLGPAKTWPPTPIDQLNAIRLALRFWKTRYGHEVEPLSIDNPPHVDDLEDSWRVWVLTPRHQLRPLEVNINKKTHELTEMQDAVKGAMRGR